MAYAAVVSLKHTIEQLLSNDETKDVLSLSETMLIYNELPHLISFLKTIKFLPNNKIVDPASEKRVIDDAVQKLEDLIDSLVSDLLLSESERSISADEISLNFSFSQQLQNVNEEVGSFLSATLPKNINDKEQQQQQQQQQICRYSSSSEYNTWNQQKNLVVGLEDQIKQLKEWIFDPKPFMSVTTLGGMTGIGKTTLAKQVYIDPLVIEKFEIRLFVHIGPQYSQSEEIVLLVLGQLGVVVPSDKLVDRENKDYLTQQLRKALSSKKYLIVLDDVWTNRNVLHTIKYGCFPNNQKGSRVIIVSQIQRYLKRPNVFLLPLLNDGKSWKLLHQTAFGNSEEKCSRELEIIGKKIARNCDGLPAAIIQVGENLRGKSLQEWKTLSENEDPLVITRDDDTPLSKALYFSYMMLSQYLKLCFLYMGVFPKYYEIFRSKLIKLWVCEGLLDPEQILGILDAEGTAGEYLNLLICQSVVLREKQTTLDDEISKNCRPHFTFRSLCVTESKSEFCFHILKKFTDCTPENIKGHKRLCVHNNVVLSFPQVHEWMESVPNARSLLCFGPKQKYPIVFPFNFRLLKIIDALAIRFYEFPLQILV